MAEPGWSTGQGGRISQLLCRRLAALVRVLPGLLRVVFVAAQCTQDISRAMVPHTTLDELLGQLHGVYAD